MVIEAISQAETFKTFRKKQRTPKLTYSHSHAITSSTTSFLPNHHQVGSDEKKGTLTLKCSDGLSWFLSTERTASGETEMELSLPTK